MSDLLLIRKLFCLYNNFFLVCTLLYTKFFLEDCSKPYRKPNCIVTNRSDLSCALRFILALFAGGSSVVGCNNKDGLGMSLFKFPMDPTRRKMWNVVDAASEA